MKHLMLYSIDKNCLHFFSSPFSTYVTETALTTSTTVQVSFMYLIYINIIYIYIFNRPGVAGAVLQTPLLLIN